MNIDQTEILKYFAVGDTIPRCVARSVDFKIIAINGANLQVSGSQDGNDETLDYKILSCVIDGIDGFQTLTTIPAIIAFVNNIAFANTGIILRRGRRALYATAKEYRKRREEGRVNITQQTAQNVQRKKERNTRLKKLSNTSWKQPFTHRKKVFHLWDSQSDVATFCNLSDGTKRFLRIQFEERFEIDIVDKFQITSGKEISFPKNFQDLIKPIIINNPDSYFIVSVLDVESDDFQADSTSTTGLATIKIRIGQLKFRNALIEYWGGCAVTRININEILKASHIKPWSKSNDLERLDKYNGLLLNPTLDTLFDRGFITFSNTGKIKISKLISNAISQLGINNNYQLSKIEPQHKPYLDYHRNNVYKP